MQNTDKTRMALGVRLPDTWDIPRAGNDRAMQGLHEALIYITADFLPDLCKELREYHLKVLQSLEAGDNSYHAVKSLWGEVFDFLETETEDED